MKKNTTSSTPINMPANNNTFRKARPLVFLVVFSILSCYASFGQSVYSFSASPCVFSVHEFAYSQDACSNCAFVRWDITGNYTIVYDYGAGGVMVYWNTPGTYQVRAGYSYPMIGVIYTNPVTVTIGTMPMPTISGPSSVCVGSGGNVYSTQPGMQSYSWSVSGGTINSGANSNSVSVTWNTAGTGSISLTCYNSAGCSGSTGIPVNVSGTSAPTASSATSINTTSFVANWSNVSGAGSYQLDVSTNSSFSGFVSGYNSRSVTGNSHTVSGLGSGTTYYYRLRSVQNSCASGNSNTVSATTTMVTPAAPVLYEVSEQVTGATGFPLYCSEPSGTTTYLFDVSRNSAFTDFVYQNGSNNVPGFATDNLAPGTTYYCRVRAQNAVGTSPYSNIVTVTTKGPAAPVATAATNLTVSSFTANWTSVSNASSYRLDVSTSSAFASFVSGYNNKTVSGTSDAVTGLSSNVTYYYRVRAVNPDATSINSNSISCITPLPPNAPTATAPSAIASSSFTANWTGVAGATTYHLDVSENSSFSSFVSGYQNRTVAGTSESVTGLSDYATYYYRVRVSTAIGTSSSSNTQSVFTDPALVSFWGFSDATPSSFKAEFGLDNYPGTHTRTFTYHVQVSTTSNFSTIVHENTFSNANRVLYTVNGLNSFTTYYFRVRYQFTGGAWSPYTSGSGGFATPGVPAAPVLHEVNSAVIGTTGFPLYCSEPPGTTTYLFDISRNSTFTDFTYQNASSAVPGFAVDGNSLTTYYCRVRAQNVFGTSPYSNTVIVTTKGPAAPVANPATGVGMNALTANWNSVMGATDYRLDVSTSNTFATFVTGYNNKTVTGTSDAVTGLNGNTTYYYRVRAVNGSDISSHSNTITTLTTGPLTAPNALAATGIRSTSFVANWSAVTGATSYELDLSFDPDFSTYITGYNNRPVTGTSYEITDLAYYATYYYRVRAVRNAERSPESNTRNALTDPLHPFVGGFYEVTASSFMIYPGFSIPGTETRSWKFHVQVSTTSDYTNIVHENTFTAPANQFYLIPGINTALNHYVRLRFEFTGGGWSPFTESVFDPPDAPVLQSSHGYFSTDLFFVLWTPMPGMSHFLLDVAYDPAFTQFVEGYHNKVVVLPQECCGGYHHFEVTNVPEGTRFYNRLRAVSNGIPSQYSNTAVISTIWPPVTQQDKNMIISRTALQPVDDYYIINGYTTETVQLTVDYFDGLGRPAQQVNWQASPSKKDIVTTRHIDAFGREPMVYLPYQSTENKGFFKPSAVSEHSSFYQSHFNDNKGLSKTVFENAPLNRVRKQGAPGEAWQPNSDNTYASTDRTVKKSYETNVADEVLKWTYVKPTAAHPLGLVSSGTASAPAYYGPNQLNKNMTKDEHHHEVIEYIDKQGKLILKKVQAYNDTYAQTYYIYDNHGSLVCVLQPEGTKNINDYFTAGDNGKEAFLKKWAFRYTFDGRRRQVMKQVPGAEPVYLVYDKRDRLVLTQDGAQRKTNRWAFTKYDTLNRPVITGIYTHNDSLDRAAMSRLISTTKFSEIYNANATYGYTNNVFPTSNLEVHTITYYDNYGFRSMIAESGFDYRKNEIPGQYQNPDPAATVAFNRLTGQVTGTRVKVLGENKYLWHVNYYDDRYRIVQTIAGNTKSGTDCITNVYDFVGKVLKTRTTHTAPDVPAVGATGISTFRKFNYDHAGRLLKTWHHVNGADTVLLSQNEYNELGQVVTTNLHNTNPASTPDANRIFRQQLDYRYNIRGWLTRINNSDLSMAEDGPRDYFGMNLFYNETASGLSNHQLQFNGNISAMKWSTNLGLGVVNPQHNMFETRESAYTFSYDTLNRLKAASHHALTSGWNSSPSFYEGGLKYDLNGNIRNLNRTDAAGDPIDQLSYTYAGNQLIKVSDSSPGNTLGFIDGTNLDNDYAHDANGNMSHDRNKGINTITYNHLNLPDTVRKNTGEYIKYAYDAMGRKLSQEVYNASNTLTKRTDYIGEFFYENDTLKFISHEEGRIVMTATAPEYQYHLKDHLGNIRTTFTTRRNVEDYIATLENAHLTEERADFPNYDDVFVSTNPIYNHTAGAGATRSVALNGADGKQVGLAKSLKVIPGDTINMAVYAKYFAPNPGGQPTVGTAIVSAVTGAFGLSANSTGPEYSAFQSLSEIFNAGWFIGPGEWEDDNAPKAYLNYILFDEDFIPYDIGWDQIDAQANNTSNHDALTLQAIARKPGYAYIYFSNENSEIVEVYFDDFKIEHIQSPIVQMDDYYPFGMTFNSHQKENGTRQDYKYNGKEEQIELGLGWLDYGARMYQPELGRFFKQDRFVEGYMALSPYNYTSNNPINFVDVNGDYITIMGQDENGNKYSVLYEKGKAYHYLKDKNGNIVKGDEYDGKNKFIEGAVADLNSIASTTKGERRVDDLQDSKETYGINEASQLGGRTGSRYNGQTKSIYYYQGGGFLDGVSYSKSFYALGHELQHAWDHDQTGSKYFEINEKGHKYTEKNAVAFENYLRAMFDETKMRQYYSGTKLFNQSTPEYFKNLHDPLGKNEDYFIPTPVSSPTQDATRFVPNWKPRVIDSRTKKIIN